MKDNQPSVALHVVSQRWSMHEPDDVMQDRGHGRAERRLLWALPVDPNDPVPGFPSAKQMIQIVRETSSLDQTKHRREVSFAITSRGPDRASPRQLQLLLRGHWCIENRCHWVRDVTFDEDRSRIRVGAGAEVMATLRNLAISVHRLDRATNIAAATRACVRDTRHTLALIAGHPIRQRCRPAA